MTRSLSGILPRQQEWAEARRVQDRINSLITIILQFPVFPAIKTILKCSGIDCGECIAPRQPLNADEKARLRTLLEQSGDWENLLS
jgi:dihydrodipicolinate synthase/N-acetylneuraminate lyase